MTNFEKTMNNLRTYFNEENNHYLVAVMRPCSEAQGFICEALTEKARYFVKIMVDNNLDMVHVEMYPGITVAPAYRTMTAQFITQKNSESKIGVLEFDKYGTIFAKISTSIQESPMSGDVLEFLEVILLHILKKNREALEAVSHGMMPDVESRREKLVEEMQRRMSEIRESYKKRSMEKAEDEEEYNIEEECEADERKDEAEIPSFAEIVEWLKNIEAEEIDESEEENGTGGH